MHFQLFCQTFLHLSKCNKSILNGRNGISPRLYKASDLLHNFKPPKSNIYTNEREAIRSLKRNRDSRDFAFFLCLNERNISLVAICTVILVLQRPCNEAALSPGIDAFWY